MSGIVEIMRGVARAELAARRGCRLAVVTATHPHKADDDENNYEIDVRLKHEELELVRVPVLAGFTGFAATPKVGDLVLVEFLGEDLAQPMVVGCLYHSAERPPKYADGELVIEHRVPDGTRNELRFTAEGTIRVTVQDKITLTLAKDGITLEAPNVPVSLKCKELNVTAPTTISGNTTVNGTFKVDGGTAGSTTISGHEIKGA